MQRPRSAACKQTFLGRRVLGFCGPTGFGGIGVTVLWTTGGRCVLTGGGRVLTGGGCVLTCGGSVLTGGGRVLTGGGRVVDGCAKHFLISAD